MLVYNDGIILYFETVADIIEAYGVDGVILGYDEETDEEIYIVRDYEEIDEGYYSDNEAELDDEPDDLPEGW